MKHAYYLILFLLVNTFTVNAQHETSEAELLEKSKMTIEAIGNNTTKTGLGKYFMLDLSDDRIEKNYCTLLTTKTLLNDANEIRFIFKRKDTMEVEKTYEITIPIKDAAIIQHPDKNIDLVAIPLFMLSAELKKKYTNIDIDSIYFAEEDIAYFDDKIKIDDLIILKKEIKKFFK